MVPAGLRGVNRRAAAMNGERGGVPLRPNGAEELDELQRGEEQPISVELLEKLSPKHVPEAAPREIQIPDPGARPGAIRPAR
jgi:hypothetical protein